MDSVYSFQEDCVEKNMNKNILPRTLSDTIKRSLRTFPVTLITGPRQSGKTTLLKEYFNETYDYVSLDRPDIRERALVDPLGFLKENHAPIIIDEIQNVPELLNYIKAAVDDDRKPGQWLLSGSQNFSLMQGMSETLAGRISILTLLPFSFAESLGFGNRNCSIEAVLDNLISIEYKDERKKRSELAEQILRGMYPEICFNKNVDRQLWCSGYIQTYLERDVRQIVNVGDLSLFTRFLRLCASRTGTILNMSEFSRSLGVSSPTIRRWLSILEASYQVFLLPPYHRNFGKRIVKSPKLYFLDTALATYLIGLHDSEPLLKGPMIGKLFETMVVNEFIKMFYHRGERPNLYYFRSKAGVEIDLLIERNMRLYPMEIKSTATVLPGHVSALLKWKSLAENEEHFPFLIAQCDYPFTLQEVRVLPWNFIPDLFC